jgi:hypothetical protein
LAKKLSVYLADDLWQRAQRLGTPKGEKPNASALVQRALELMLREQEARTAALSTNASIDHERLGAVVDRVRSGARAEFERGYAGGLDLAEIVGFGGVSEIIQWGSIENCEPLWEDEDLEDYTPWMRAHSLKFEQDEQYEAFRAGADKAVRDVWDAVRSDNWGIDAGTTAPEKTPEEPSDDDETGERES